MLGIDPDRRRQAVTPARSGVPGDTEPRSRTGYTASRDVPRRSPSEATKAQASGVVPRRHAGGTWEKVPGQGSGQRTGQLRSAWSDDHPAKLPGTRCDAVVTTEIQLKPDEGGQTSTVVLEDGIPEAPGPHSGGPATWPA